MITNRRSAALLGRITLGGLLAIAGCSSGGGGDGSGRGGSSGGSGGSGGASGTAGTGGGGGGSAGAAGGTTGTGGDATGGTGGSNAGSGGGAGTGGSAGTAGGAGGSGGNTAGAGGGAGTGGRGGNAGSGGAGGGSGGATGGAGGRGGGGGGTVGTGGGGGTNCAGHAISFNTNVAGKNDPAMAIVNVPFNADLPSGNANRTIECWAYMLTTSWASDANSLFFYGTNNRNNDGFGFDFGTTTSAGVGTIDPFTNGSSDSMGDNKASGVMANTAQWVHFAMTWDGTNVRGFVNGVEKDTVAVTTMLHTGTSAPLIIGGYPPNDFNGQLDEFRIWNVARTATEIQATMNKTLVGNEPGLVAYYKFDETTGATAADSVTTAGHTAHPGTLMANTAANLPTWIVSTAPISCP